VHKLTDETIEIPRNKALTTRGKPFQKGNPGRPKGSRHRVTMLAERLMEKDIEGITNVVVAQALEGSLEAAALILARIVPVRKGRPVTFAMPNMNAVGVSEAFSAVIAAVAAGRLTCEEGKAVADLLDMQRKAIETGELAERFAALERKMEAMRQ
jgi:hypothetical protein